MEMLRLRLTRRQHVRVGICCMAAVLVGLVVACAPGATSTAATGNLASPPVPTPQDRAVPTLGPVLPSPTSSSPEPTSTREAIPVYTYRILETYPHDPAAFTEGLAYDDGVLYEGTGLNGRSTVRRVALESGEILQQYALPAQYFGEGITIYNGSLVQLTWKSHVGFVYDKDSFRRLRGFTYPTEGWGLTNDGKRLIMSDGTATLRFLDPDSLEQTGQVEVRDDHGPVTRLNELEYVNGEIYANVWKTNRIARINPKSGAVTGWIDLTGLLQRADVSQRVDVLNGIAYDAAGGRLFVTGKWWPKLFQIELIPTTQASSIP